MTTQSKSGPAQDGTLSPQEICGAQLRALLKLGRLKFLPYSAVLFGLGATIALYRGDHIALGAYVYGQLFIWCVHLMTHYCNEYFDLEADRANPAPTRMTGGSRVLVDGLLSPVVALTAAMLLLFIAVFLLSGMASMGARAIGCAMLALAWFYTAPPFRFNYRGLGEITVSLVLNILTPLLGYYLQVGAVDGWLAVLLLPPAILQVTRMMLMNLMDYEGDLVVGKRTSVTMIGRDNVKYVYAVGQAAAYALVLLFVPMGLPKLVALLFVLTLPLSIWQGVRLWRNDDRNVTKAGSIAFWASTHVAVVVAVESLGLLGTRLFEVTGAIDRSWLLCAIIPALFLCLIVPQARKYQQEQPA